VRIAFVIGFFDPVKIALDECYPEPTYRDRLIWIPGRRSAVIEFKGRFYDVVRTAEAIHVCLGRSENQSHIEDAVRGIVRVATERYASTTVTVDVFGNQYDPEPVMQIIKSLGIETRPQICSDKIRTKVGDGKILCMSLYGKTSIFTALERAGFPPAAVGECFHEEVRAGARNSNLMEDLKSCAAKYTYLIYAWEGLRTLSPDVKNRFKYGCQEARSASQVVELFKRWIIEGA
jgi:hypothetical protein